MDTRALIDKISESQKKQHLNDTDLAQRLGVTSAAWSQIKSGTARPGIKFLSGVVRVFPELQAEVLLWMRQNAPPMKEEAVELVENVE